MGKSICTYSETHGDAHTLSWSNTHTHTHTQERTAVSIRSCPIDRSAFKRVTFAEGSTGLDKSDLGAICVWVGSSLSRMGPQRGERERERRGGEGRGGEKQYEKERKREERKKRKDRERIGKKERERSRGENRLRRRGERERLSS